MPTYGYECQACENQFEVFQRITDDPLKICNSCGGTLRKRIYPVGISFKGSGFYVNDYAAKPAGGSSSAKAEKPAETASEPAKTETAKTEKAAPAPSTPAAG